MRALEYDIYDVVDKREIHIAHGGVIEFTNSLNISRELLPRLYKKRIHNLLGRYILASRKSELIFTLVNYETKQEYDCCCNKTILYYLGLPIFNNKKMTHSITQLRSGLVNYVKVGNIVFSMKGETSPPYFRWHKNLSPTLKDYRTKRRMQKKIRTNLSGRIYKALKRQCLKKSMITDELIGCPIDNLFSYLSERFLPGMSWDNYGKWHVDHIRPCVSFDLFDPEQQKTCFHYSNLQPLWATDNLRKGARMPSASSNQ